MSLARNIGAKAARARGASLGALACLALGTAVGCKAYPTREPLPLDCSIEDRYEIQLFNAYDTVGPADLWTARDTDAAVLNMAIQPLTDGDRCGSTAALLLESEHQHDWGALFGFNGFGERNQSAHEGMSFWARAPGATGKTFIILLDDPNTNDPTPDLLPPASMDSNCTVHLPDGGVDGSQGGSMIDPATGMVIGGGIAGMAPYPDQCGNSYSANVVVTTEWAFYTVPFSEFQQSPIPSRVPNSALMETGNVPGTGLITSRLKTLIFRMPKEQKMELWIDNLGFYRRRAPGDGSDGGAGAP